MLVSETTYTEIKLSMQWKKMLSAALFHVNAKSSNSHNTASYGSLYTWLIIQNSRYHNENMTQCSQVFTDSGQKTSDKYNTNVICTQFSNGSRDKCCVRLTSLQ